ncbi:MAG: EutN/CcmL family microcompartment protein [Pirellulaceae bacterium]|nr:EutN/CcmL family microcompartment protein [Planctomycetales bacterium]
MRIAEIIGTVTLNRIHPALVGGRFRLGIPLTLDNLRSGSAPTADPLVIYDELGVGNGGRVMVSEGAEAAQPFRPEIKPVDAYNAGIIDHLHITESESQS